MRSLFAVAAFAAAATAAPLQASNEGMLKALGKGIKKAATAVVVGAVEQQLGIANAAQDANLYSTYSVGHPYLTTAPHTYPAPLPAQAFATHHAYAAPLATHAYAAPLATHAYAAPLATHAYAAPLATHAYASHAYAAPLASHAYATHAYAEPLATHAYAAPLAEHVYGAHAYAAPVATHVVSPVVEPVTTTHVVKPVPTHYGEHLVTPVTARFATPAAHVISPATHVVSPLAVHKALPMVHHAAAEYSLGAPLLHHPYYHGEAILGHHGAAVLPTTTALAAPAHHALHGPGGVITHRIPGIHPTDLGAAVMPPQAPAAVVPTTRGYAIAEPDFGAEDYYSPHHGHYHEIGLEKTYPASVGYHYPKYFQTAAPGTHHGSDVIGYRHVTGIDTAPIYA